MAEVEAASDLGSYAALFSRRKVWLLTIVPGVLLLSVFLAFALPAQYRSTATLYLEAASIPDAFIKSTVRSYEDQQIDIIQGRVLTIDALKELVQKYDPYPDEPTLDTGQKALRIIQNVSLGRVDPVTFQPKDMAPAVSINYLNPDPRRASDVTSRIADLFLSYHQKERIQSARDAAKIVQDRADELTKELQSVDEEYARLRAANGGTLPDLKNGGDEARYRAERDLTDQEKQLREAQERESLLTIQLGSTSPNLLVTQGLANGVPITGAGAPPTGLTDIATVKAELADAELRYTPDHPDVKRLKRALAALEATQNAATVSPSSADNPEYRRISGQLASAKADVAALQASTARARAQLAQYAANANPSSALERQIADIDRRKQSLQTEYLDTQEKLKSAQLGQVAESGRDAEHFTILQSPYPASQPYSPNRIGVIALGFVLGCMIAGVAVAIAENGDATVRGSRDLAGFGRVLPILANIPDILLPSDVRRKRLIWGSVIGIYLLVVAVDVVTVGRALARVHRIEDAVNTATPTASVSPSLIPPSSSTSPSQ